MDGRKLLSEQALNSTIDALSTMIQLEDERHKESLYTAALIFLQELEEYRRIGTLEECTAAAEKEIPQKPLDIEHDLGYFVCRNCGETIGHEGEWEAHRYCLFCGQRIDWSAEV